MLYFCIYLNVVFSSSKSSPSRNGPVYLDLTRPAVDQLWSEVEGIISFSVTLMLPFLQLFGVEEGNGLSPFAVSISSPE